MIQIFCYFVWLTIIITMRSKVKHVFFFNNIGLGPSLKIYNVSVNA